MCHPGICHVYAAQGITLCYSKYMEDKRGHTNLSSINQDTSEPRWVL